MPAPAVAVLYTSNDETGDETVVASVLFSRATRGISNPLFVLFISSAALAFGVEVPIPTCEKTAVQGSSVVTIAARILFI
jgi:hypothetical protein